jgi:Zn-dependent peptidase ImmA (M78 family)/DNA-binding XRE family transcriptional regulator
MFNPQRLSIARKRRAMSKKGFAELIGVTPNTIIRYETGEIAPTDENIGKMAASLGFSVSFFHGKDVDEPRRDNASFRGMASKSGKVMDAALASGALAFLLDDWIASEFYRSGDNLLDLQLEPPETAAMMLRQHWRLGDKPIKNMVHLLEANGVRVFSLAENTTAVDAFSLWRDDIPYVFLNRFKSAERSRFDAAHELAHLCLHKHGGAHAQYQDSEIEKQANAFAGAFLMPESDLKVICNQPLVSVDHLVRYKKRWRVSAAALNYRAREVGLISDARCNSNYVEMSRRGWLRNEPDGIGREQSYVWQEIINDLNGRGITKSRISEIVSVPPSEIEALLFGLANMMIIDGQGSGTPRRKVELRLIKNTA